MSSAKAETKEREPTRAAQDALPGLDTVIAIAISAAAYHASTGLGEAWPLAWIAPLPVLVLAFRNSARTAALAAFAAYFAGSLNLFTYLTMVMPFILVIGALLMPALAFVAVVLLTRYAFHRVPSQAAVFVFPAAWTSYEFLLSVVSPHGTAFSLAYSQTDFLPLVQIASLTGIWGVTFVLTLVPSAIAVVWCRGEVRALVPSLGILLVVLAWGAFRLQQRPDGLSVRVGLAASDPGINSAFATEDPAEAAAVIQAYAGRVARLASAGAKVVILPEKLVGVTPVDSTAVTEALASAARTSHVTLIAGLNRVAIQPLRNVAIVFASQGSLLAEYDKHHLLPGPEAGYRTGGTPVVFPAEGGHWGVAICKDMDFPQWLRQYGKYDVRLMAVPAWDFVRDARLHSRMAVMRGVENGFTMARVANQGYLTFSDGFGRILREAPSGKGPDSLLTMDVTPGPGPTPYTHLGDWFGWISMIGFASLLAAARLRARQARGNGRSSRAAAG